MQRFVAFDVETPNHRNHRMSAIGITVVEDGMIVEEFESFVNPETEFDAFNIRLTGINEEVVADAPIFPELWPQIRPFMESGILVAHNAVFDLSVLRRCLEDYAISWRDSTPYLCTVQMGRRLLPGISHKLNDMCSYYGLALEHHRAGSDIHACAEILLHYLNSGVDAAPFLRTYCL